MTCGSCAASLEKRLRVSPGVKDVAVNFATSMASIVVNEGEEGIATRKALEAAIQEAGYGVLKTLSKSSWRVKGMTCSSCAAYLEKCLLEAPGIVSASVNFATCSASVEADPSVCSTEEVRMVISNAGFGVEESGEASDELQGEVALLERSEEKDHYRRYLIFAIVLSIPMAAIMIAHAAGSTAVKSRPILFGGIQAALATPCVLFIGRGFFIRAAAALRHRTFTMDTLVAVGVGGVYLASVVTYVLTIVGVRAAFYFDTAGMLVTFMTLGKYLESLAKSHTCSSLTALMKLNPETAHVVTDVDVTTVKASSLKVGDVFRVFAGEKIPADGKIIRGTSDIDEHLLTGESIPRVVGVADATGSGAEVIGGTLNLTSTIDVVATRVGSATTLSKIVRIVEDAQSAKPPIQRIADRIAGVFVPVVIGIGLLVLAVWLAVGGTVGLPDRFLEANEGWAMFAFNKFLATIVVACPCALGLATPTAIMVGTSIGARRGILIKSGVVLEAVSNISCVIFDKTGTLTTGHLRVVNTRFFDPSSTPTSKLPHEVLTAVIAVEQQSTHPVARAVVQFLKEELGADGIDVEIPVPTTTTTIPGRGISAVVNGVVVCVGSAVLAIESAIDGGIPTAATDLAKTSTNTTVFVVFGGRLVAVLFLQDEIRDEARSVVEYFHNLNKTVLIVSGDNERAALAVAQALSIPDSCVFAGRLPAEKISVVASVQQHSAVDNVVCFVGDGINDAPALAQANVGVAIGAGTDVAIETADAVLMHSSLLDLASLHSLARKVVWRIKVNFLWACAYNCIMIPFAAGLFLPIADITLPPLFAGFAMAMSSVTVVCSSLLLRTFKPPIANTQ